jgi:hypothetical protein
MKLNLGKMSAAVDEFEAKRAGRSKTAAPSTFLLEETLGLVRWALEGDSCRVCEGAGWLGAHDVGCPVDVACSKIGLKVLTQRCPDCSARVEVFGAIKPSSKKCERCQFFGKEDLYAARALARQRYERLEGKGKSQAAQRQRSEAKRLSRLFKEVTGQPFGRKAERDTVTTKRPSKGRQEKR